MREISLDTINAVSGGMGEDPNRDNWPGPPWEYDMLIQEGYDPQNIGAGSVFDVDVNVNIDGDFIRALGEACGSQNMSPLVQVTTGGGAAEGEGGNLVVSGRGSVSGSGGSITIGCAAAWPGAVAN